MVSNEDDDRYWMQERDWLVEVVHLPVWDKSLDETLHYVGRLCAFAMATDTRMLAQVGDPELPAYELWFSFKSESLKQEFLQMVRDDGYADPDDETCLGPPVSLDDLKDLRPVALVFPKKQGDLITAVTAATFMSLGPDPNLN